MESPHAILQVDPDADADEIDRAYRQRLKETHPDHGGSARDFQRVRAAYETLQSDDGTATTSSNGQQPAGAGVRRDRSTDEPAQSAEPSRVEYVDYEVIAEAGWDLEDPSLFDVVSDADLDPDDHGRILAQPDETLLQAAEHRGFEWPYSCRGGACANCAVAVLNGELSMPVNHILPPDLTDRGIRLSCVGRPITDELQVVYNLKHLPELDELRLPPRPFEDAAVSD